MLAAARSREVALERASQSASRQLRDRVNQLAALADEPELASTGLETAIATSTAKPGRVREPKKGTGLRPKVRRAPVRSTRTKPNKNR